MDILGIAAVLLLVAANGFFVAAEFSLVSVRRTRIDQLAAEGNRSAKITQNAINHLDSYIAATQLGITLASLALGWIGEPAIGHLIEAGFELLHIPETTIPHSTTQTISVVIAFSIVTLLHIVFGELAPKSIALQSPEPTALFVSGPTALFLAIFRPIIWVMNGIGNAVVRLLGFHPAGGHTNVHSPEELEMLVKSSRQAGLLEESEERLLRRVFDFSDIQARQIMKPRTEVHAISVTMPLKELLTSMGQYHYSRYPVYEGSIDTVIGVLHMKDLLDRIVQNPTLITDSNAPFDLKSVLREPLFIPETVGVDDLLEKMRRSQTHIAIIIDEYGGMAGVVTMEDIIEELVGEVDDEFDDHVEQLEGHAATLIEGLTTLTEIKQRFGEPDGEVISTTLGGFIAERLDRIPVVGDIVRFGDYDVQVEAMEGLRASKLRFIRRPGAKTEKTDHKSETISEEKS